ncbi:hypothetical protein [Pseudomonas sp. p1(2021b)]|uniref:hypothetical protein n=1 Tax=Pseudomonas sp. p1(2021b) TaxID=2874628 RepID=UPI003D2AD7C3
MKEFYTRLKSPITGEVFTFDTQEEAEDTLLSLTSYLELLHGSVSSLKMSLVTVKDQFDNLGYQVEVQI